MFTALCYYTQKCGLFKCYWKTLSLTLFDKLVEGSISDLSCKTKGSVDDTNRSSFESQRECGIRLKDMAALDVVEEPAGASSTKIEKLRRSW